MSRQTYRERAGRWWTLPGVADSGQDLNGGHTVHCHALQNISKTELASTNHRTTYFLKKKQGQRGGQNQTFIRMHRYVIRCSHLPRLPRLVTSDNSLQIQRVLHPPLGLRWSSITPPVRWNTHMLAPPISSLLSTSPKRLGDNCEVYNLSIRC